MKTCHVYCAMALALWFSAGERAPAATESLNWQIDDKTKTTDTCLYGEITVLATIQGIYYCAADFDHGYTGIQHLDKNLHTALFSIWDTSPKLKAIVTAHDPKVRVERFGGEGEGSHANLDGSWKLGETYKFFLRKRPGKQPKTTDTRFYVVSAGKWRHVATINAANGPKHEQEVFGCFPSWIENIGGTAPLKKPKIVLYDLWLGPSVAEMKRLTRAGGNSGDGAWGQLHDHFFVAEGGKAELKAAFAKLEKDYGKPVYGKDKGGKELPPISDKPLPAKLIEELKYLPH